MLINEMKKVKEKNLQIILHHKLFDNFFNIQTLTHKGIEKILMLNMKKSNICKQKNKKKYKYFQHTIALVFYLIIVFVFIVIIIIS